MVTAVFAPDSKKSLEMYEECISSVVKVFRECREVVPGLQKNHVVWEL